MTAYTRNMPNKATYWPPGSNDGFGGTSYGSPITIPCRWQYQQTLFRDNQGREVVSEAVVYVGAPLKNGGMLARGEFKSATVDTSALEIRAVQESPNLSGTFSLHKVTL